MLLGEKIKTLRDIRGFTLKELELQTGISDSYLSKIESGLTELDNITFGKLKALSWALGVDINVLTDESKNLPK